MFRSIQVPWDGSAYAEHALPLAVSLARRDGAALQIVRVYEPMMAAYSHAPETFEETLDRELLADIRKNLEATVASLVETTGYSLNFALLEGPVAETLAMHAATSGADLLVMTTQARGPIARMWFGSVSDALVRQTSTPILFTRPQDVAVDFTQPPPVQHVLIPLDGSTLAEQALAPALSLGGAEQGEFTLLRVIPAILPAAYDPIGGRGSGVHLSWHQQLHEWKARLEIEALAYLEQLAARMRARSLNVRTQLVAHELPANAILETAQSLGADVIALTTRGHGGLKRLFLGSVADKVIRGADIPVLICPPDTESGWEG